MGFRIVFGSDATTRGRKIFTVAAWIIGGGALVGLAFVSSFFIAMKVERRSNEVRVPLLVGLSVEEAEQRVSGALLTLEVIDERHDPEVPSGKILEQRPPEGASVRRGRKIKLLVSLGGQVLTVPSLAGKANRTVEIELRRAGFAMGDQASVFSRDVPEGKIVAQVPPSGSPGVPSTRVHRLVSLGQPVPQWVMPDLTRRGRREAERWIERSGFRRGPVRLISHSGLRTGTVVGQSPLAGYPIRENDVVELTVVR